MALEFDKSPLNPGKPDNLAAEVYSTVELNPLFALKPLPLWQPQSPLKPNEKKLQPEQHQISEVLAATLQRWYSQSQQRHTGCSYLGPVGQLLG